LETQVSLDLYDIVMRLVGPVQPTGDSGEDVRRLGNMKALIGLMEDLMVDVLAAAKCADQYQDSMRRIGVVARDFVNEMRGVK
jgi:hypothetical protein